MPAESPASADRRPTTQAERQGAQALADLERGKGALDRGEAGAAIPWLERATRYAPDDPTPRLTLGAARLAAGDNAGAAEAFARVTAQADMREAWLGLAIARWRLGDRTGAGAALARCLSAHRWVGPDAIADAIAEALGRPWCALRPDERVTVSNSASSINVDGMPWAADRAIRAGVRLATVDIDQGPALGSPIEIAAIRRLEGIVAERDGGLEGWAWHPADPDRDPRLTATDGLTAVEFVAADLGMAIPRPLMRPRRFHVPSAALAELLPPITVQDAAGQALPGSPVSLGLMERAAGEAASHVAAAYPLTGAAHRAPAVVPIAATVRGPAARAPLEPDRPIVVVIPAYRGEAETLACVNAVRRTAPDGTRIVVVEDASPEPALVAALEQLAGEGVIALIRTGRNLGFPAAANAGLRAGATLAPASDLLLLNADALPAPGAIAALRAAVHAAPDIGTATPFSNDGSLATYPDPANPWPPPPGAVLARLARLAAHANPGVAVDVPTGVGFCLYLRRECVASVGVFRDDLFAQGYGEENDFCRRASHLGWRHVVVPGAYVAHHGGRSFGAARQALLARNVALLEQLHPGYAAAIAGWQAANPLGPARAALDAARWRDAAFRLRRKTRDVVLFVTHDGGGGVERQLRTRMDSVSASGGTAITLRPVLDRSEAAAALDRAYIPGLCRTQIVGDAHEPVLTHRLPEELPALMNLLRAVRPVRMEVHHLLGHDHAAILDLAARLGLPYDMHVHDYAAFCPRVTLVSTGGRYCGEPPVAGCEACVADLGSRLEEPIGVSALIARSAAEFADARRVIAPSADTARRIVAHFPDARPVVEPHEHDGPGTAAPLRRSASLTVCVVGAIGLEKGFDVLLGCARDAASRGLPLRFHVVGHTIDDERLLATGCVGITGPYAEGEAATLIRAAKPDLGFLPSVWPETWCYALSEAWAAGLDVMAFDIGAQAERIRASGRGWLVPLGLPPQALVNALLGRWALATGQGVMQTL